MTKTSLKEFRLSDEVPEAVREMERENAERDWKARLERASSAVVVPEAPYRIRGDSEAGAWFVEEARVVTSAMPNLYSYIGHRWPFLFIDEEGRMVHRAPPVDYAPYVAALKEDQPTAKLVWEKVVRKRRGFFTRKEAAEWLQDYLEPVLDESTYYRPNGHAV